MFMIDVTHVKYVDHHNLEISFADGLVGIVDVDKIVLHYDGVFEPLNNLKFFAQVSVEPELGTIVWPNGADLCPDVLYAHASGQSQRLRDQWGQTPLIFEIMKTGVRVTLDKLKISKRK